MMSCGGVLVENVDDWFLYFVVIYVLDCCYWVYEFIFCYLVVVVVEVFIVGV